MCGFVGIWSTEGARADDLSPLLDVIHHRGPDGTTRYAGDSNRFNLGFCRLAIIDLVTGDQPVSNEDGSVVAVLNGEIYNYVELTAELVARGHRFKSHGDAEVLVHLYEERGDAFLDAIEGMFAVALWDVRKRRLLLARDPVGIKPLYVASRDGSFAFASEVKPLLRLPWVGKELSPQGLTQYLSTGYVLAPETIFRDVRKILPGHKIAVDVRGPFESSYWDCASPAPLGGDPSRLGSRVLDAVDASIAVHLRSDVALGAFLSGGLDSSLLVARASRMQPGLKTYTLSFSQGGTDESELARLVAERSGTTHKSFVVDPSTLDRHLPRIVWSCDEPLADSGLLPNFVISELAAQDGVKVVLNGAGGDELFAGYTHYFPSPVEQTLGRVPWVTNLTAGVAAVAAPDLARKLRRSAAYDEAPAVHYAGHAMAWPESLRPGLIASDVDDRSAPLRTEYMDRFAGDALNKRLYADIKTYLTDDILLLLDRMTMAHSIEGRVPFVHRPLVELMARIPGARKAPGGERKGLLREIAKPFLPAALFDQPKVGFNAPIWDWFRGPVGIQIQQVLTSDRAATRPWWNERVYRRTVARPPSNRVDVHRAFILFMLELFARVHIDGRWDAPPDVALASL